jgi:hypothetical protein
MPNVDVIEDPTKRFPSMSKIQVLWRDSGVADSNLKCDRSPWRPPWKRLKTSGIRCNSRTPRLRSWDLNGISWQIDVNRSTTDRKSVVERDQATDGMAR